MSLHRDISESGDTLKILADELKWDGRVPDPAALSALATALFALASQVAMLEGRYKGLSEAVDEEWGRRLGAIGPAPMNPEAA